MKEYEITYLADPKLEEEAKAKLDESIDKEIQDLGGEISYSSGADAPGSRRRLHYPVKGQRVTWLRVVQTRLEPDKVEELRDLLRKKKEVLRVILLQTERREEVSASVFQEPQEVEEKSSTPKSGDTKAKEVTMEEVEEKIEKALEEEVK